MIIQDNKIQIGNKQKGFTSLNIEDIAEVSQISGSSFGSPIPKTYMVEIKSPIPNDDGFCYNISLEEYNIIKTFVPHPFILRHDKYKCKASNT